MYAVFRYMLREHEREAHIQAEYHKRQGRKEIQKAKMRAEEDRIKMAKQKKSQRDFLVQLKHMETREADHFG
ncbi:uncharacterized protein EAF02_010748 [Botrytis sinoallii]|uniref:uncharacterized protein n=1 Tax=Botrytis sinoallii TaxID=1463999 RepID=UPI001900B188|nr:uncharacterized protein EAF02_010748 [Botrytis sinoallii]KAF7860514.1 hypothetical protein EAF02_010748 [Botrytis sinoallii]